MQHRSKPSLTVIAIAIACSACITPADEAPDREQVAMPERRDVLREAAPEPVLVERPTASSRQLERNRQTCLERGHAMTPGLSGRLVYEVRVRPDGRVQDASIVEVRDFTPAVIECIRLALVATTFPPPGDTGTTIRDLTSVK